MPGLFIPGFTPPLRLADKKRVPLEVCKLMRISTTPAIAVGDGVNDLPMMTAAGLSMACHHQPAVREQAMVASTEGGMGRVPA